MKKRSRGRHGMGSVYLDGKAWIAALSVGSGANRRRVKAKCTTEAEAREALRRLHAQHGSMSAVLAGDDATVETYLHAWLEGSVRPTVRATTYDTYESILRTHVYPRIGALRVDRVRKLHLVALFAALEKAGVGARLREIAYTRLRAAFSAIVGEAIATNPMTGVPRHRVPRRTMNVWNADQARAFLAATAADELGTLYRLALSVGLRRGELLALRAVDLDARERRLRIQHTLTNAGDLVEPKTAGARRAIDLPDRTVTALVAHRQRLLAAGLGGSLWLFPVETKGDPRRGEVRLPRAVARAFTAATLRAGLPVIRFHDLRHTCATLHLANRTHPKVVSEMLGHASIQITLDTYSHVLPSLQRDAADRFDAVL